MSRFDQMLFKGPCKRLLHSSTQASRDATVSRFLESGVLISPNGMTAALVVEHCIKHRVGFVIEYEPPRGLFGGFVVTLAPPKGEVL